MNLLESIKENEGFRSYIYKDTLGFETIGYGFKVSSLTSEEIEFNGGSIEPMSEKIAGKILERKVKILSRKVFAALPWLEGKPQNVQDVIIEMAYQLGLDGMLNFKNTLNFIKEGDFTKAGENMRKSRWYNQTLRRVERLIKKLKDK